jgi:hypothetical protein
MPKRPMFAVLLRVPEEKTAKGIEEAIVEGARARGFEVTIVEVSEADEACLM